MIEGVGGFELVLAKEMAWLSFSEFGAFFLCCWKIQPRNVMLKAIVGR